MTHLIDTETLKSFLESQFTDTGIEDQRINNLILHTAFYMRLAEDSETVLNQLDQKASKFGPTIPALKAINEAERAINSYPNHPFVPLTQALIGVMRNMSTANLYELEQSQRDLFLIKAKIISTIEYLAFHIK